MAAAGEFMAYLSDTAVAHWVIESSIGYPALLVLHSVGLSLAVGNFVLLDLRLLGLAAPIPLRALLNLMPLSWIGLWMTALSGSLLFTADAVRYSDSLAFRLKLLGIVLGVLLAHITRVSLGTGSSGSYISRRTRGLAACSLLAWIGVVTTGRLTAYLS